MAKKRKAKNEIRVLIRGGGFVNKGAEAMVRTVQSEIGRRLPSARFYMQAAPGEAARVADEGFVPVPTGQGKQLPKPVRRAISALHLLDMHALVDVSGHSFAMGESAATARHFLAVARRSGSCASPWSCCRRRSARSTMPSRSGASRSSCNT